MKWLEELSADLESLRERTLLRRLRRIGALDGPFAEVDGHRLLNLCHNDYLGLSREPEVIAAAREALARWGTGAAASRLVTGHLALFEELEAELAAFKGTSAALAFPTGYQTNLGVLSALAGQDDAVFVDRYAHACLVDGVRLSDARLRVFPHNDVDRLEALLAGAASAPRRWVLVDGVFSMDGDICPLARVMELAEQYDAIVVVDDAHGTGVVGERGRGTFEHFGLRAREWEHRLVLVATLSKALGAQGGVALGSPIVRESLLNRARTFIYTTGLAPASAGAAMASVRLITREPQRVARLQALSARARTRLTAAGLDIGATETPIIPVMTGTPEAAVEASRRLVDRGLLVLPIRPPTVPKGTSRLRFTVSTLLDESTLDSAVDAIIEEVSAVRSAAP